jgi:thioredoxin 1
MSGAPGAWCLRFENDRERTVLVATLALTKDNFKDKIEKGGIVFIDWWADWCGPCKAFAPVYEKVAEANPDITFAKIDTDKEQELAAAFGIRSIPTLMIFREGIPLFAQPGALPQQALEELVEKVRALDMEEVRRSIAEQQPAEGPGSPST